MSEPVFFTPPVPLMLEPELPPAPAAMVRVWDPRFTGADPLIEPMVSSLSRVRVPLETATAAVSAMAEPPLRIRTPPVIWVWPVWVLAPDSVSVPLPCLTRPPAPLREPENVVFATSPVVSVLVAAKVTLPAPASEPMVSLSDTASVAPEATVTAVVSASAPPLRFSVRVPADTVVAPV